MDISGFIEWQQAKPNRIVKIELGSVVRSDHRKIWVFDYDIMSGQYVSDVSEITLDEERERRDRAELERLKAKYEAA